MGKNKVEELIRASRKGEEWTIRLLLNKGVDINAVSTDGSTTALCTAVHTGALKTVQFLLKNGADASFVPPLGVAPVMLAVRRSAAFLRELLSAGGVDPGYADSEGKTPLMLCAELTLSSPLQVLLKYPRLNVNATDTHGRTALMFASNPPTVQSLLDAHADASICDRDGRTALDHARSRGNANVVNLLEAYVTDVKPSQDVDKAPPIELSSSTESCTRSMGGSSEDVGQSDGSLGGGVEVEMVRAAESDGQAGAQGGAATEDEPSSPSSPKRQKVYSIADEVTGQPFYRRDTSPAAAAAFVRGQPGVPFVLSSTGTAPPSLCLTFLRDGRLRQYQLQRDKGAHTVTVAPVGGQYRSVMLALRALGLAVTGADERLSRALQTLSWSGASTLLVSEATSRAAASADDRSWLLGVVDRLHGMDDHLVLAVQKRFGLSAAATK